MFLDLDNDGLKDPGETETLTGTDGSYSLPNYRGAGTFTVAVQPALLYTQAYPTDGKNRRTVTFASRDQIITDIDFGYRSQPGSVSGVKWLDTNGNGVKDLTETAPPKQFQIYVDMDQDAKLDLGEPAAMTDTTSGFFRITGIPAGVYQLREVQQPGYRQTYPVNPIYHEITIRPGEELKTRDFGNNADASSDFGDAAAPYPTLLANNGPRHGILNNFWLGPSLANNGAGIDAENDGFQNAAQPTVTDDTTNVDDEDGVTFTSALVPGNTATVDITVTLGGNPAGKLQGWIDFNHDGDWADPGEQIFTNRTLGEGVHTGLSFIIPAGSSPGSTWARFRYGYETDLSFVGPAYVGEVEDYAVDVLSDQPIATADQFTVPQDSNDNALNVLLNDIPSSSGRVNLKITSVSAAGASGKARIDDNGTPTIYTDDVLRYTPAVGALAPDSFTYTVSDVSTGKASTALVTITITPTPVDRPIAVDDSFSFPATSATGGISLDVLKNDLPGPTGSAPINSISTSGAWGTTLGSVVLVSGTPQLIRYTPSSPAFRGTDQFAYTIKDANNLTATAVVTVHVLAEPTQGDLVRYRVEYTDDTGKALPLGPRGLPQVAKGDKFQTRVYVQDMRGQTGYPAVPSGVTTAEQGVFSAYMDLLYDTSYVSYKGDTTYSSEYPAGHFSQIATVAGILNEVGGFQASNSPLGPTERLLYFASFTATTTLPPGATFVTTTFKTDPADDLPLHETALNKPPEPSLGNTQIQFGESGLEIVDLPKQAQLRLEVTDLNGNPLPNNQILAGSPFYLRAWVDDLRNLPAAQQAIYSAYLDVTYDKSLASPVASASNGLNYDVMFGDGIIGTGVGKTPINFGGLPTSPPHAGQSGDFSVPGFINEIGAFQQSGVVPFTGEALLFQARFTALAPPVGGFGTLVFAADPADILPLHEVSVLPQTSVPPARVDYVSTPPVTVIAAAGEGEFTNPTNAMDVNDDGAASPVDALILINFLNEFGSINLAALTGGAEGESRALLLRYQSRSAHLRHGRSGHYQPLELLGDGQRRRGVPGRRARNRTGRIVGVAVRGDGNAGRFPGGRQSATDGTTAGTGFRADRPARLSAATGGGRTAGTGCDFVR